MARMVQTAIVVAALAAVAACSSSETEGTAIARVTTTIDVGAPSTSSVPSTSAGPSTSPPAPSTTSPAPAPSTPLRAIDPAGSILEESLVTGDGRTRTYRVYVPRSMPNGRAVPLLIALHGGTGWGEQFATNSGFDGLAEANGFVAVYPDGVGTGPGGGSFRTWNGGNCCGPAVRQQVDDVAFVNAVIDTVSTQFPIDAKRVFVAGHSNGGIMAYRLACELSDRIAAIGVQSSSLGVDGCRPTQPVSLLHIHGTADTNLPIDGGRGSDSISGVDYAPAIDGVRVIAAADACGSSAETVDSGNPDLTRVVWADCERGSSVEFLRVSGAPHAWMGHAPSRPGTPTYLDLDSSFEIWKFLAVHPRP